MQPLRGYGLIIDLFKFHYRNTMFILLKDLFIEFQNESILFIFKNNKMRVNNAIKCYYRKR